METGTLVDFLLSLLIDILACAEIILFLNKLLLMRIDKRIHRWIIAAGIVAGSNLFMFYFNKAYAINIILLLLKYVFVVMFCITGNAKTKLAKGFFAYAAMGIIWTQSEFLLKLIETVGSINFEEYIQTVIQSLSDIIIVLVLGLGIKKGKYCETVIKNISDISLILWAIIFFIYTVVTRILIYSTQDLSNITVVLTIGSQMSFTIMIFLVFVVFLLVDNKKIEYKNESEIKDVYINLSKEHYKDLETHINSVRKIKHDINALLNAIESLIDKQDYLRAKEYISTARGHQLSVYKNLVITGNDLVDAVISGIIKDDKELRVECSGNFIADDINDYDLCIIMSNLFQNAYEAVTKSELVEKRIKLNIKYYDAYLMIEVINPIDALPDVTRLGHYTTKSDTDSHGYGIQNVIDTVNRYKGEVEFVVDKKLFCARIQIKTKTK